MTNFYDIASNSATMNQNHAVNEITFRQSVPFIRLEYVSTQCTATGGSNA